MNSTLGSHAHYHHKLDGRPHVTRIENESISKLAPFAGIIVTISLVVFFLVRYYVLEKFLLVRCYGETYLKLNENQRRAFLNHHLGAAAKALMLVTAAYPFFAVIAGPARVSSPFAGSTRVTLGDGTLCCLPVLSLSIKTNLGCSPAGTEPSFRRHVHLRDHLPHGTLLRDGSPPHRHNNDSLFRRGIQSELGTLTGCHDRVPDVLRLG